MIEAKTSTPRISKWDTLKARLKVSFPQLTDTDLNYDEAQKNEMLKSIQVKLGKSIKDLKFVIDTL